MLLVLVLLVGLAGIAGWVWAVGTRMQSAAWATLRLRVRPTLPWTSLDHTVQSALAAAGGGLIWRVAEPASDTAVVLGLPATAVAALQTALLDAGIDHHLARVRALHLPAHGPWWRVTPLDGKTPDAAWMGAAAVTLAVVRGDRRAVVWASHAVAAPAWTRRRVWVPASWHRRILPLLLGLGRTALRGAVVPLLPDPGITLGVQIPPLTVGPLALPLPSGATLPLGSGAIPLGPGQSVHLVGAAAQTTAALHQILTAAMTAQAGVIAWVTPATADAWLAQVPLDQRPALAVVDSRQWATSASLSLAALDDDRLATVLMTWVALSPHDPACSVLAPVIRQWRQRPHPCPTLLLALLMELPPTICAEAQLTGLDRQLIRMRWMTRLVPLMRQQWLGLLAEPALDLAAWRAAGGTLVVVQPADAAIRVALQEVLAGLIDAPPSTQRMIDAPSSTQRTTVVVAETALPLRRPETVCVITTSRRGEPGWHWFWCVGGTTPARAVPLDTAGIARVAVACLQETSLLLHPSGTPAGTVLLDDGHAVDQAPLDVVPLHMLSTILRALTRLGLDTQAVLLTATREIRPKDSAVRHGDDSGSAEEAVLLEFWTIVATLPAPDPVLARRLGDLLPGAAEVRAIPAGVQVEIQRDDAPPHALLPLLRLPGTHAETVAALPWATLRHMLLIDPPAAVLSVVLEGLLLGWSADTAMLSWLGPLPAELEALRTVPHWDADEDPDADLATRLRTLLAEQMVPDADPRRRLVVVHAPVIELALARALVAALRRSTTAPLTLVVITQPLPPALDALATALPVLASQGEMASLQCPGQPLRVVRVGSTCDLRWIGSLPSRQRIAPLLAMPEPARFWAVDAAELAPSLRALGDAELVSAAGDVPRETTGVVSRVRRAQPVPLTREIAERVLVAALAGNGQVTPRMLAPLFPAAVAPDWAWLAMLARLLPGVLLPPPGGTGAYRINPQYQSYGDQIPALVHQVWSEEAINV